MSHNGVVLPDTLCPKSCTGGHHYEELGFGSEVFRCKHCKAVRWFPNYWDGAVEFSRIHGRFYQDIPGSEKLKELLGEMATLGWIKKSRNEDKNKTYYTYVGG